ncbi:MAG: SRPBCC family protein [Bacteroidales bacterium]
MNHLKQILLFFLPALLPVSGLPQAASRTDTLPSGELMLRQEILIDAPVARVWDAFTRPADWQQWVSPVVEMDIRNNGYIRSHYSKDARIGDPGTVVIRILTLAPGELLVMQAETGDNFPAFIREKEKDLYSIFRFEPVNEETTQVVLYGTGYLNEPGWTEFMQFFIHGNESTLNRLKAYLEQRVPGTGPHEQ